MSMAQTSWHDHVNGHRAIKVLVGLSCALAIATGAAGLDDIFLELTQEFSEVLDLERADPVNDTGNCFNPVRDTPAAHPLS